MNLPHTLALLLALAPGRLSAQDDRENTTPTATLRLGGQTAANLQNLANSGWRFTDIEIESVSSGTFLVIAVANTGAYYKQWSYSIGVTAAQLSTTLSLANMRPIDIEAYDDNGTTRLVAISISNTGVDASTGTTWLTGASVPGINSLTSTNKRLTNLEAYAANGNAVYAVTAVNNFGPGYRAGGWDYARSAAQIASTLTSQGWRLYDLHRVGNNIYDYIAIANDGERHWHYFDQSSAQVSELQQQNIARIIDIERRTIFPFTTSYDVVMIDNANALERTARQAFDGAPANALGDHGFFLKEVGGPVLANMRADTEFEPAGLMGIVYHVHAMRRVATGPETLATTIPKPLSCGVTGPAQALELTLRQMMEGADDMATLAIGNHFGLTNIDATAGALGMANTDINYTIGCSGPSPHSTMTLRDLSTLHEQVAGGYLGSQRAKFYELMHEGLSFPSSGNEDLVTRIDAEAANLGMPLSVRDSFKAALHLAYRDGGIAWFEGGLQRYYHCEGGWMSVPFKNASGLIVPREYTFGAFNHDFTAQQSAGRDAMSAAELALVWDRVHAAMLTWNDHHASGALLPMAGVGCLGSGGVPTHTATGTPELFGTVDYHLANAPANAIFVAVFGFSSSDYQGIPLPFDLAPIGAFACILRTSVDVQFAGLASAAGTAVTSIAIGTDPSTIGTT